MVLHLYVILFTGEVSVQRGGLCPGDLFQGEPPYGYMRVVRILLECILFVNCFCPRTIEAKGIV